MPYPDDENQYDLPVKKTHRIEPLGDKEGSTSAADLIRQKISGLYESEPAASEEKHLADSTPKKQRSKHQAYMHELSVSGKSLAEIQVAWHDYYQSLPDNEKHEVWQEFYEQHNRSKAYHPDKSTPDTLESSAFKEGDKQPAQARQLHQNEQIPDSDDRSITDIKQSLLNKISSNTKKQHGHLKSLLFGLGMGSLVIIIAAFGFFNERFIAPFITPSTVLSSTPLILDENGPVSEEPKIIIPKINLEIPVVYGTDSIAEDDVQDALEDGVLHYPITPEPGEVGNSVFFGHSSNNILNRGNYKFAFVLLNQLEPGDTFMLEKDGTRYVYRVFDKEVVPPNDFSVLDSHPEKESIATLITCDPPGTSINRLAVYGEQISPDPAENSESSAIDADEANQPNELPSDAPTLWQRLTGRR